MDGSASPASPLPLPPRLPEATFSEDVTSTEALRDSFIPRCRDLLNSASDLHAHTWRYYSRLGVLLLQRAESLTSMISSFEAERELVKRQLEFCRAQADACLERERGIEHAVSGLDHESKDSKKSRLMKEFQQVAERDKSIDRRLEEMDELMRKLREKGSSLESSLHKNRTRDMKATDLETRLQQLENELTRFSSESARREAEARIREKELTQLSRSVEDRERDANRTQKELLDMLKMLEAKEHELGLRRTLLQETSNIRALKASVRSIMDDFDMNIEKDVAKEEIE